MCDKSLLDPIFLLARDGNELKLKHNIADLLTKGIVWKHHQIYSPTWINQQSYKPTPRWNWNKPTEIQKSENWQARYFWACETLTRLKVIYGQLPQKSTQYLAVSSLQSQFNEFRVEISVYSCLALSHLFWCQELTEHFIGWKRAQLKAFEAWLRLADHINLLFDEDELKKFGLSVRKNPLYFVRSSENPDDRIPPVSEELKKRIKTDYNNYRSSNHDNTSWRDFSLPFWDWNEICTSEAGIKQLTITRPTDFTNYIGKINYFAFLFDADLKNKGLDAGDGGQDRFFSSMMKSLKKLYGNHYVQSEQILSWCKKFVKMRDEILKSNCYIEAQSSEQNFKNSMMNKIQDLQILNKFVKKNIDDWKNGKKNPEGAFLRVVKLIESIQNNIYVANGYPLANSSDAAFHPLYWLHNANVEKLYRQIVHSFSVVDPIGNFLRSFENDLFNENTYSQQSYITDVHDTNGFAFVASQIRNRDYKYVPWFSHDILQLNPTTSKVIVNAHNVDDPYFYRFLTAREMYDYSFDNYTYKTEDLQKKIISADSQDFSAKIPLKITFTVDRTKATSQSVKIFRIFNKAGNQFKKAFGGSFTFASSPTKDYNNPNWQFIGVTSILLGKKDSKKVTQKYVVIEKTVDISDPKHRADNQQPEIIFLFNQVETFQGVESTQFPQGIQVSIGNFLSE